MDFDSCWQKHQGLCQEIIDEINKIRKSPKSFVQYVDAYIENTEDGCLFIPDSEMGVELEEGLEIVSTIYDKHNYLAEITKNKF